MASNFPQLSVAEATESCKELFGPIIKTEEDIKHPKPQKMQSFYSGAIQKVYDLSQDQVTQAPFQAMQELVNLEIFEESVPLVVFSLIMQRFISSCGVNNLTIKDVLQPKPKKTLMIISAILNYAKFKESRYEVYENAMAEVDAIQDQKHHLLVRNEEIKAAIESLQSTRFQEEEQKQKILPAIEECQREVNDLNKCQAEEMNSIQETKALVEENKLKLSEIRVNAASLKEECEKCKSQIFSSPERLIGEIPRKNNLVQVCKEENIQKNKHFVELISQKNNREKFLEKAQNSLQIIQSLSDDMDKEKETLTVLEKTTDVLTTQMHLVNDLVAKMQNIKHSAQSKLEKQSRQTRQHEKKTSSMEDEITQSKRANEMILEGFKSVSETSRVIMEQKHELDNMLKSEDSSHIQEMTLLQNYYKQLLEQLDEYHRSLAIGYEELSMANERPLD